MMSRASEKLFLELIAKGNPMITNALVEPSAIAIGNADRGIHNPGGKNCDGGTTPRPFFSF
jgi:hypothetical protein